MADLETVPANLLEAVNAMLSSVGAAEIMSLNNEDTNEESRQALSIIRNANRDIQMRGWHCNEENALELSPSTDDGSISLPNNTARFALAPRSYALDVTQRGSKLYDRRNHTFVFTAPVYCNLVVYLDFDDLPEPIRWYVTTRAGRIFATGKTNDSATFKFTNEMENDAMARAMSADDLMRSETMPDTNYHFFSMRRR